MALTHQPCPGQSPHDTHIHVDIQGEREMGGGAPSRWPPAAPAQRGAPLPSLQPDTHPPAHPHPRLGPGVGGPAPPPLPSLPPPSSHLFLPLFPPSSASSSFSFSSFPPPHPSPPPSQSPPTVRKSRQAPQGDPGSPRTAGETCKSLLFHLISANTQDARPPPPHERQRGAGRMLALHILGRTSAPFPQIWKSRL